MSMIDIISPRLTVISPALFTSFLKEKEPATFSELWDAILLLTKGNVLTTNTMQVINVFETDYPESWILAGTKKPILPKFYNFLRNGLNGAVHIGYPSILILIANFPSEVCPITLWWTRWCWYMISRSRIPRTFTRISLRISGLAYLLDALINPIQSCLWMLMSNV